MAAYEISLPADISAIALLTEWVAQSGAAAGLSPDLLFKLTLSLEEAVMNVVSYAFADVAAPPVIEARLEIDAKAVAAEVIDNGRPFDPTAAADPDLEMPIELRDPGGLGIYLIRQLMDRVDYHRADGCNHLRMEKSLDG